VAFSEVYVDPSIAADSGTGTIGDPYGDLEYAIEQTTFDTTNGTRVNIKAGTAEVIAAEIGTAMADAVTTPAWVQQPNAPAVFQGYASVAGDGGVASIDCNGLSFMDQGLVDYCHFAELSFTNPINNSAKGIIVGRNYIYVTRCAFYCGGIARAVSTNAQLIAEDCYVENAASRGIYAGVNMSVSRCHCNGMSGTGGVFLEGRFGSVVQDNIIVFDAYGSAGSSYGINATYNSVVRNNSVYGVNMNSNAGIQIQGSASHVYNNLVEGWSGTGGVGIRTSSSNQGNVSGNGVYNCTTAYSLTGSGPVPEYGDNETLTASPFNDAANGDFSPVDTGNVIEGALPNVIGGGLV
jgi:hypothetical protein